MEVERPTSFLLPSATPFAGLGLLESGRATPIVAVDYVREVL